LLRFWSLSLPVMLCVWIRPVLELDFEHRWLATSMHVDNFNLVFHSLVKNVFDVLLGLFMGAGVLKFVRSRSDPNVHLWKTVKHVHFVFEQVLLLKSWYLSHSCVSWLVGYLEQSCVKVVQSLHFNADLLVFTFTSNSGPEIIILFFFIKLYGLCDMISERFNQLLGMTELIVIWRFAPPDKCLFVAGSNYNTGVTTVKILAWAALLLNSTGALAVRRLYSKHSSLFGDFFLILFFWHSLS